MSGERRKSNMTRKAATTAKAKIAPPGRPKKQIQKKRPKAQWHEEAVIHQDVFCAEAPTQP
jgi:hypothetical protein